jgi:hypothetical protein
MAIAKASQLPRDWALEMSRISPPVRLALAVLIAGGLAAIGVLAGRIFRPDIFGKPWDRPLLVLTISLAVLMAMLPALFARQARGDRDRKRP